MRLSSRIKISVCMSGSKLIGTRVNEQDLQHIRASGVQNGNILSVQNEHRSSMYQHTNCKTLTISAREIAVTKTASVVRDEYTCEIKNSEFALIV